MEFKINLEEVKAVINSGFKMEENISFYIIEKMIIHGEIDMIKFLYKNGYFNPIDLWLAEKWCRAPNQKELIDFFQNEKENYDIEPVVKNGFWCLEKIRNSNV